VRIEPRSPEVTAVVCAALDSAADREVRRCRHRLTAAGLPVRPPRHRPHLTLGAVRLPEADVPAVAEVAARVASAQSLFPLRLDHLGVFAQGTLWLGPRPSSALDELQAAVDAALAAAGWERAFGRQTEPAEWTPHVTLANRLTSHDLGRAVELLSAGFRPVRGAVDALAVIMVGGEGDVALTALAPPAR
jgi:2'-5' RNA ligase